MKTQIKIDRNVPLPETRGQQNPVYKTLIAKAEGASSVPDGSESATASSKQ